MSENASDSEKIAVPEDGIGDRIRLIRESKNITHDGLSSLTKNCDIEKKGISRTTIRGYELGTYKPGTREIRVLSEALEVSPTYLILGTPQPGDNIEGNSSNKLGEEKSTFSFGKGTQTIWAFMELPSEDKELVRQLILSILRHKFGEVEFRKLEGTSRELGELVDDVLKDAKEGANLDLDPLKNSPLIIDSMKRLSSKYGFDFPEAAQRALGDIEDNL